MVYCVFDLHAYSSHIVLFQSLFRDVGKDFDKLKSKAMNKVSVDTSTCDSAPPNDHTHPVDHTHPIGSVTHINQTVNPSHPNTIV